MVKTELQKQNSLMDFKLADKIMYMAIERKILTENNPTLNAIVREYAQNEIPTKIKLFVAEIITFVQRQMENNKNG